MSQTPIVVRGKKARQPSDADDDLASAAASPASSSSASKRQRTTSGAGVQSEPHVSFDQRFPLEVVEKIYLLSQNPNLELCSKRLHWMLSRREMRVEMVQAAFSPVWDFEWTQKRRKWRKRADDEQLYPGDPSFQTALLQCPWVDVPLLLDAEQRWMRRTFPWTSKDGGEVLIAPRRRHAIVRRPMEPVSSLAYEFRLFGPEADAIQEAHRDLGCADHGRSFNLATLLEVREHSPYEDDTLSEISSDLLLASNSDESDWVPTPPPAATHLPSAHACFAYEALNATFRLSRWHEVYLNHVRLDSRGIIPVDADGRRRTTRGNAVEDILQPLGPYKACYNYVHPDTVIPERLLCADGAPPVDLNARLDEATLEACRARLQRSYELLLWLVIGGAQLQRSDSSMVTLTGTRRLMALAAADARTRPAGVLADPGATPAFSPGAAFPIRLSVDAICTSMLALYSDLGVYEAQWSEAVLYAQINQFEDEPMDDGLVLLDDAFRSTKAYDYFLTIASEAAVAKCEQQDDDEDEDEDEYLGFS